ncbi:MAG: prohibitin family protein [Candidatus Kapabacteria bacterium]|nr:prohibitin family protein [Candidatus Kapabacteria bacterium]
MFLFILGFIVLFVGIIAASADGAFNKMRNVLRIAGIIIMGLGILTSAVRQIDSGAIGVLKLFGQVQKDRILYEGLNFVNPLYDVEEMNIRQLNYTMSSVNNEGQKAGDDAVKVRCNDGLEVTIDVTILYRLQDKTAPDVFQTIGPAFEEEFVRPVIRAKIRESAVYFAATDLYSEKRQQFENLLREKISKDFEAKGFFLEQVLVRNVMLPQTVTESIERKIAAMQDAQRQDYILEKVRKEADMKRVEAQGTADAQKILASGLSDKVLQYESIKVQKELVNSPNSKIIMMGGKAPVILDAKDGK